MAPGAYEICGPEPTLQENACPYLFLRVAGLGMGMRRWLLGLFISCVGLSPVCLPGQELVELKTQLERAKDRSDHATCLELVIRIQEKGDGNLELWGRRVGFALRSKQLEAAKLALAGWYRFGKPDAAYFAALADYHSAVQADPFRRNQVDTETIVANRYTALLLNPDPSLESRLLTSLIKHHRRKKEWMQVELLSERLVRCLPPEEKAKARASQCEAAYFLGKWDRFLRLMASGLENRNLFGGGTRLAKEFDRMQALLMKDRDQLTDLERAGDLPAAQRARLAVFLAEKDLGLLAADVMNRALAEASHQALQAMAGDLKNLGAFRAGRIRLSIEAAENVDDDSARIGLALDLAMLRLSKAAQGELRKIDWSQITDVDDLVAGALAYQSSGNPLRFKELAGRALERKPDEPDALLALAGFYEDKGLYRKALPLREKLHALLQDPQSRADFEKCRGSAERARLQSEEK